MSLSVLLEKTLQIKYFQRITLTSGSQHLAW